MIAVVDAQDQELQALIPVERIPHRGRSVGISVAVRW